MAIIGESAQAAKVVAVGQQVPGGAQLHSVYSDRAIIDRGGVLESVFLPRRTEVQVVRAADCPRRWPRETATKLRSTACASWSATIRA